MTIKTSSESNNTNALLAAVLLPAQITQQKTRPQNIPQGDRMRHSLVGNLLTLEIESNKSRSLLRGPAAATPHLQQPDATQTKRLTECVKACFFIALPIACERTGRTQLHVLSSVFFFLFFVAPTEMFFS